MYLKYSLSLLWQCSITKLNCCLQDRDRIVAMINELGGVVAENTKMEMMATHFISILPNDTFTGMMVCSLATGKWLLHVSFIYDSFRCKKFLRVSELFNLKLHTHEIIKTQLNLYQFISNWV